MELHDGYAILHGDEELDGVKAPLPEDWTGPVIPEWVPERFTNVSGSEMQYNSNLIYMTDDSAEMIVITTWNVEESPMIDNEDMYLNRTLDIQGTSASLYTKAETGQLFLTFTINDFYVQICGNVSEQEIIEVAENLQVN